MEMISQAELNERLASSGLRVTPQRLHVYEALLGTPDHPTAEDVFFRVKQQAPEISMATIYNCLDALVKCGLVRQVSLGRDATRYCANMRRHTHFHCERCGRVFDIDLCDTEDPLGIDLPQGFQVRQFDLSFRGACPECSAVEFS